VRSDLRHRTQERQWLNHGFDSRAPHINLQLRADIGEVRVDKRHRDWSVKCWREATTRDPPHHLRALAHFHCLTSAAASFKTEPNEFAFASFLSDALERVLTDESTDPLIIRALVDFHRKGKTRRERICVLVNFMAIQRHSRFHSQRIARAQSNRSDGTLPVLDVFEKHIHRSARHGRTENHFNAIFAGVSRATDNQFHHNDVLLHESIALERRDLARERSNNLHRLGSLQRDHRGRFRLVFQLEGHIALDGREMRQQFGAIGCIAHHQIFRLVEAVHNHIVEASTLFIADDSISALTDFHAENLPSANLVEKLARMPPGKTKPSHMRDIEESSCRSTVAMLIDDRTIEKRHLPTSEVDHLAAVLKVKGVEGSPKIRGVHLASLAHEAWKRTIHARNDEVYPRWFMSGQTTWMTLHSLRKASRAAILMLTMPLALATMMLNGSALGQVTANLDDESLTDRPVSEVVIEGLARVTEQAVRNNMRVAVGQPFESRAVKDDVSTLYRLGQFDSVTADAELLADGTVRIRYIFIEQPLVLDIQVVGNKVASDQELRAVIGLYAGGPRDDFLLERAVEKIKNLYRAKGNYLVEVTVDETRLFDTGILIFRIVEGPRVRIREIVFSGNDRFDTNQLGAQIKTKPWVFIFSMGNLDQDMLIDDVAALDKFYKDRGFLDVRVDKRVEISASGKEAKVVFVISEGRQYRLRSVTVESADGIDRNTPRVLRSEQVLGLMVIRPGDFYTIDQVEASTKAVTEAYQTMGYLDARVDQTWIRLGEEPEVDMIVTVRESTPVTAGLVRIQGNYITKDNVIRRKVRIQPGRPLDGHEMEESKKRLEGSGLFNAATITPQTPDANDQEVRDVLVEVKERNTGSVNFGVGVGSDSGFFGTVSLNQQNFDIADTPQTLDEFVSGRAFRGAGQSFSIAIAPGIDVSNYSISFGEPNLLESDYGFGSSLLYRNRVYTAFNEDRIAGSFGLSRVFGDMWNASARMTLQSVTLTNFATDTPIEVYNDRGPSFINSVGISFARTNFDNPMRPSRGSRFEADLSYFGAMGGPYTFPMAAASYTTFLPLSEDFFGRKSILKLNTSAGYIFQSDAPVSERFYLGGRSLRGFLFRSVSPLSAQAIGADPPTTVYATTTASGQPNGQPIGGTFRFFAGAQYEVPIFDKFVSGVIFTDSGTVTDSLNLNPYRASIGCGLRLYIPQLGQAPLAFDFAKAVLKTETDQTETFSFTAELPF